MCDPPSTPLSLTACVSEKFYHLTKTINFSLQPRSTPFLAPCLSAGLCAAYVRECQCVCVCVSCMASRAHYFIFNSRKANKA